MNEAFRRLWKRMSNDSLLFLEVLCPKKPHPGQVRWLRESHRAINTLVPGNRWGKSTVIAMKHIHKCVFKVGQSREDRLRGDPYETISVAMSADQAEIVFKEAKRLLQSKTLRPLVRSFRSSPFPHIVFTNGSIMHCRSAHDDGKYIDGHRYMYLSIDEAGWIVKLRQLMTNVILMRLAGGGEIDLIGTPKGYNDLYFYFERGQRGVPGYYSQRGSIYDNPFLPEEDIKMRDALLASADPKMREQVLYGEFVDFTGLAFTRDQRDNAFDPRLPHHQPRVDDWCFTHDLRRSSPAAAQRGCRAGNQSCNVRPRRYVVAWDLGRTTDFTVGIVLDISTRPWHMVSYTRLNRVAWEEIYATIDRVAKAYKVSYSYIDATGPQGDVIEEELIKRRINVYGYKSSTRVLKTDLINTLQNALDEGRIAKDFREVVDVETGLKRMEPVLQEPGEGDWGFLRLPCVPQLMDEMGVYSLDDKDIPFTDSVMSLALATHSAYEAEYITEPVHGGLYGGDIAVAEPDRDFHDRALASRVNEALGV